MTTAAAEVGMASRDGAVCARLPVTSHLTPTPPQNKKPMKPRVLLQLQMEAEPERLASLSQCSALLSVCVRLSWTNLSPRGWASCLLGTPGAFPSDALSAEAGLYLQACVKGSMATEQRLVKTLPLNVTLRDSTQCYVRGAVCKLRSTSDKSI